MRLLPVEGHSRQAPAALWNTCGCAKLSTCLSRRSGVPSALGHIGCCSATRLVADTSRAEPADQHGPVRKDTHQLFRGRIQRWSTQVVLIVCHLDGSQLLSLCDFLIGSEAFVLSNTSFVLASSSRHSVKFITRQGRQQVLIEQVC